MKFIFRGNVLSGIVMVALSVANGGFETEMGILLSGMGIGVLVITAIDSVFAQIVGVE